MTEAPSPMVDVPSRRRGRPRKHPPAEPSARRRGGQPGNRNRWRHGRYSAAMRAAKAALRDEIAEIDRAIIAALQRQTSSSPGLFRRPMHTTHAVWRMDGQHKTGPDGLSDGSQHKCMCNFEIGDIILETC
jgi:hypothetical protein